jgi:hypothetical protein
MWAGMTENSMELVNLLATDLAGHREVDTGRMQCRWNRTRHDMVQTVLGARCNEAGVAGWRGWNETCPSRGEQDRKVRSGVEKGSNRSDGSDGIGSM